MAMTEEEGGDAEFVDMVLYFWQDKGDPTNYFDWDEARCIRLMPAFWHAYQQFKLAEDVLTRVARSYQ